MVSIYDHTFVAVFSQLCNLTSFHLVIFPEVIHYLSLNIPLIQGVFFSIIVVPTVHLPTRPQDMDVIRSVGEKEETMTF